MRTLCLPLVEELSDAITPLLPEPPEPTATAPTPAQAPPAPSGPGTWGGKSGRRPHRGPESESGRSADPADPQMDPRWRPDGERPPGGARERDRALEYASWLEKCWMLGFADGGGRLEKKWQ